MRLNSGGRRGKITQSGKKGQVVVYVCAIFLGVIVAYAVIHANHGSNSESSAVTDAFGRGSDWFAQHRLAAAGSLHRLSGRQQSGAHDKILARQNPEEESWLNQLDDTGCKATEELRVCSHRARSVEITDVVSGSLSAYPALWKAKVKCFDIDFVATSDGHLLASHPDDLQHVLPVPKYGKLSDTVGQHSLAAVRQGGADEERFPTMEAVLQVLAKLLEVEEDKFWLKEGLAQQDYSRLPGIFMDLKGDAFKQELVKGVAEVALKLQIVPHVALFVMDEQQEAIAHAAGFLGPLIRGFMDRADPSPTLTANLLSGYAMVGPSINMADAFFERVSELDKPVHAWTVDTPKDLHRALQMQVDSVISNRPLALRTVLFDWRDRCSEAEDA